jgi:hypothetical protein
MNKVFIPMSPDNVEKILSGKKTTTIRSQRASTKIGLFVGESGITEFGGREFIITNRGPLTIEEAGGKEKMWESESFGENGPMYQQTINWLNGKGTMYVYEIKNV